MSVASSRNSQSFPEPDFNGKEGLLYWSEKKPNSALSSYKADCFQSLRENTSNRFLSFPLKLLSVVSVLVYALILVYVFYLSSAGVL